MSVEDGGQRREHMEASCERGCGEKEGRKVERYDTDCINRSPPPPHAAVHHCVTTVLTHSIGGRLKVLFLSRPLLPAAHFLLVS